MLNQKGLFRKGEANLSKLPEIREKISLALRGRKHEPLPEKPKLKTILIDKKNKNNDPKIALRKEERKKEVLAVWKKTRSLRLAGLELGITKQRVHQILNH